MLEEQVMALKVVNLGDAVTGAGGDKYRPAHIKIKENFIYLDKRVDNIDIRIDDMDTQIGDIDRALTAINGVTL